MSKKNTKPTDVQVGGDHYKGKKIQPVEYIYANSLGFMDDVSKEQ